MRGDSLSDEEKGLVGARKHLVCIEREAAWDSLRTSKKRKGRKTVTQVRAQGKIKRWDHLKIPRERNRKQEEQSVVGNYKKDLWNRNRIKGKGGSRANSGKSVPRADRREGGGQTGGDTERRQIFKGLVSEGLFLAGCTLRKKEGRSKLNRKEWQAKKKSSSLLGFWESLEETVSDKRWGARRKRGACPYKHVKLENGYWSGFWQKNLGKEVGTRLVEESEGDS